MSNDLLTVSEVAIKLNITETYTRKLLRDKLIKGVKLGGEWRVNRKDVNNYLGVEVDSKEVLKEVYIKELEGKIKALETQINAFKSIMHSVNLVIGA